MIPPLLNDFIGLQDTALVGILGSVGRSSRRRSRSRRTSTSPTTSSPRRFSSASAIPLTRFTDWLVARDRRRRMAGRDMGAVTLERVGKSFGKNAVLRGIDSTWPSTRSSA